MNRLTPNESVMASNKKPNVTEEQLVSVKNLQVSYPSERGVLPILRDVSLTIQLGEFIGLIGPSNGGKSTLLKAIAGILPISNGQIEKCDETKISLMFQEGALFDSMSVFDNVSFPLVNGTVPLALLSKAKQEEVSERVTVMLNRVGLVWAALKMPNELSGGMRRRVSLARALVSEPALALLDDPTSGLDPVASSVIMDLILELQRELGSTMLVASHDLRRLLPRSSRLMSLWDGVVVFDGNLDLLSSEGSPELQNFVQCRFEW
jgi:phospholipid/cholesterol/gamma-HCH transport system ATP-binding protein